MTEDQFNKLMQAIERATAEATAAKVEARMATIEASQETDRSGLYIMVFIILWQVLEVSII